MIEHVDADRLRDLTLELVEIDSPTGDTAVVARRFAQRLEEIGMEIEVLDEVFPATPIVIGRLRGGSYASPAVHLRCAARSRSFPGRLAPHIGFRVTRSRQSPTEEHP